MNNQQPSQQSLRQRVCRTKNLLVLLVSLQLAFVWNHCSITYLDTVIGRAGQVVHDHLDEAPQLLETNQNITSKNLTPVANNGHLRETPINQPTRIFMSVPMACKKYPPAVAHLRVATLPKDVPVPRILCFIMTTSSLHYARLNSVLKTWGKRCDKLVIASDQEDSRFQTLKMNTEAEYDKLWQKLNETLHYVWKNYRQEYDWFFKADDDTYVIVENLKAFLMSPEVQRRQHTEPLLFGRRYAWLTAGQLQNRLFRGFFRDKNGTVLENQSFKERFYERIPKSQPMIYPHGGAGYVMNKLYVEKFLQVLDGPDTFRGRPAEDLAHGATMAYHGIYSQPTRDALGRERFHPEPALYMYGAPVDWIGKLVGTLLPEEQPKNGTDCCSSHSISFHHMHSSKMLFLDQFLYECPRWWRNETRTTM